MGLTWILPMVCRFKRSSRSKKTLSCSAYLLKIPEKDTFIVMQCVAVCCSVLQCAQPRTTSWVCVSVLQCVAVCCSVLQCALPRRTPRAWCYVDFNEFSRKWARVVNKKNCPEIPLLALRVAWRAPMMAHPIPRLQRTFAAIIMTSELRW